MKKILASLLLSVAAAGAHAQTFKVQNLQVLGTFSAPGAVGLTNLAAQAANTVVANTLGAGAIPTAAPVPSCSTTSTALQWSSGAGFACNSTINAATLGGATFAAPGAIGGTTAAAGTFTALSSTSGALNGTIGGGARNAANFTTVSTTGLISPSTTVGIAGTTLADNAQAGSDGEYLTATGGPTALTTSTTAGPASLSLTAGDWDVQAVLQVTPAGTTVVGSVIAGVSTSAGGFLGLGSYVQTNPATGTAGVQQVIVSPVWRVNISTTTTYFADVNATFTVSTATGTGFLRARRVR